MSIVIDFSGRMIHLVTFALNQTLSTFAGGQSSTKVGDLSFHFRIATVQSSETIMTTSKPSLPSFGDSFKRLFYFAVDIQSLTSRTRRAGC